MTQLREAAQQALEEWRTEPGSVRMASLMMALEAALAEPVWGTTHSAECYKWHHDCAVAEVKRRRSSAERRRSSAARRLQLAQTLQDRLDEAREQRDALLEALKRMASIIDKMGDMPDGFIHPSPWQTLKCEEALEQARAAIAKAEEA